MSRRIWCLLVALSLPALAGLVPPAVDAADMPVKPVKEWSGKFLTKAEEVLQKEAPENGLITNEKAWKKLWMAWRGKEELPRIDFDKQLVVVGTAQCAANRVGGNFTLDDKGDLKGGFFSTLIGGDGFAYQIVVLDRTGVKTWNGKPIPKN